MTRVGRRAFRRACAFALALAWVVVPAACARGPETGKAAQPAARTDGAERAAGDGVKTLEVRVRRTWPHATDAFTQGLLFHDGFLFESTGQHGESSLRKVEPETGRVVERRDLPETMFGEGLALVPAGEGGPERARLVQLTWQSGIALVWDLETLERVAEHRYVGEGWGLAFDGEHLVMSNGSSWLSFRDPETFDEERRLQVTMGERPLARLNELEWAEGMLWANVWGTSSVVRIDPATGRVTAIADLTPLYELLEPDEAVGIDVLNGIAFLPGAAGGGASGEEGGFYVTGKYWPRMFEVELADR